MAGTRATCDRRPMTLIPRSTPTVLVAAGLLLLSFAGGAVAAATVTGADIVNGTVESVDIQNQTIKTKDLSPAAVAALQGADGAPGADGTDGVDGAPGVDGVSGYEMVSASSAPVGASVLATVQASCPAGKNVVGGTAYWLGSEMAVRLAPGAGGTSTTTWVADGYNPVSTSDQIELRLVCITA